MQIMKTVDLYFSLFNRETFAHTNFSFNEDHLGSLPTILNKKYCKKVQRLISHYSLPTKFFLFNCGNCI